MKDSQHLDTQCLLIGVAGEPDDVECPHHEDCGHHRGCDTGEKRHGKTANWSGSKLIEDSRRQRGRNVGVNDCWKRMAESFVNRQAGGFAVVEFFSYSLEYQNVGIHCHTDRQYESGESGQCERGTEACQCSQRIKCIDREAGNCEHSGEAVVANHDDDNEPERDNTGPDASADRVGAEARSDVDDVNDLERNWKCSCSEHERQILRSLEISTAECNLSACADRALNDRRSAHYETVEHYRHEIVDVL